MLFEFDINQRFPPAHFKKGIIVKLIKNKDVILLLKFYQSQHLTI